MAEPYAIQTKNLSKSFKGKPAVDGLSLDIEDGEIFGLVGPDGSGKTTTIRLLAAIMDPSSGEASTAGFDTVRQPEQIKRCIGYMAQRFNLYRDLTVLENLNFYADVFDVIGQQRERRIDRLLQFARLTEFEDRRAAHLSGGMQKKLALACTLIHKPRIIFLDEPTTGVDPVSRREFWDILSTLHMEGITLVISTPYMDEAERCSRVGLLHLGRLLLCDTPEQIKQKVAGELVAIWPSDLHRARELLANLETVIQVQTYGQQLRLITTDSARTAADARAVLEENDIQIEDMHRTQPRMEEAYISLIGQANAIGKANKIGQASKEPPR
ncbi:MAG TPA: ABC transporter ATP-binding protein [candidate division Zixibacteria bacterium]|nr:ABC transporter ATP-binding protein [candidate division Zixibacteria bacterium]